MANHRQDRATLYVLGMGCERGSPPADLIALAGKALAEAGILARDLHAMATIDTRRGEPAILAVGAALGISVRVFDAAALERETPRLKNPSELVYARVGCHGVAEAAALAAAGPDAHLVVAKIKSAFATAAIAKLGH